MQQRSEGRPGERPASAAAVAELQRWLLVEARAITDPEEVIALFGDRLIGAGIPLDRLMLAVEVLHSERTGIGRFWQPGQKTRTVYFPFGEEAEALYQSSPFRAAHETGQWVELELAHTPDDAFGIVPELKMQGFTHYLCIPVELPGGSRNGLSLATRARTGFSDAHKQVLRDLLPAVSALMEIVALRRVLHEVLRIYVGDEPHRRILSGQIQRGDVTHIHSAILFSDMRAFTSLSMGLDAAGVVTLLNAYFDCVVPHVVARGGEVLEFIGDSVLAIFRSDEEGAASACARAFLAAREILAAIDARNASQPGIPFEAGIGLHFGRAAYGNIGSGERLDFTVIGRDVNLASRIAGLCSSLKRPLLVSKAFSGQLTACQVKSMGEHALRGVAGMQEIFEPLAPGEECAETH
ncbi:MAG: adenylate/guanylate cyclase domain-containing protein [Methyloligellaceae bacterium]